MAMVKHAVACKQQGGTVSESTVGIEGSAGVKDECDVNALVRDNRRAGQTSIRPALADSLPNAPICLGANTINASTPLVIDERVRVEAA